MRGALGVALAFALAIGSGSGCGKGDGGSVPLVERALAVQHQVLQDVEFDVTLPPKHNQQMAPETEGSVVRWGGANQRSDVILLQVEVSLGSPEVFQTALNAEGQTERRISRSDQVADGWTLTSAAADGQVIVTRRMIQKDRRALFCKAQVQWGKPLHDPKRTEWLESMCRSLTPTKFP